MAIVVSVVAALVAIISPFLVQTSIDDWRSSWDNRQRSRARTALDEALRILRDDRRIDLSRNARDVVADLLDAIDEDPDPKWSPRQSDALSAMSQHPLVIADTLTDIARTEELQPNRAATYVVRTFDIVHWLTKNPRGFGPIRKEYE